MTLPSVLLRSWLGGMKGIRPVETGRWGAGVVICLEQGADLYMALLMPLPLTVSCFSKMVLPFWYWLTRIVLEKGPLNGCVSLPLTVSCYSKIQIGITFLVPAHLVSPGKGAIERAFMCIYISDKNSCLNHIKCVFSLRTCLHFTGYFQSEPGLASYSL